MNDKFLTYCFDPSTSTDLWQDAIRKAVDKDMPLSVLRQLCSPERQVEMYLQIKAGTYEIDTPHVARIPKNELDSEGRMKYREVYVNNPPNRVLLTVCNNALFRLFGDMVHPSCTSYQTGLSCGQTVISMSRRAKDATPHQVIGWKSDLRKYFDSVPLQYIDAAFDRVLARLGGTDALIETIRRYYHSDAFYTDWHHTTLQHSYRSLKQGCAVASWLADVVLYPLDAAISQMDVEYCRYSDDQLCLGPEQQRAFDTMRRMLQDMQMDINERKLEHITPQTRYKFLGFSLRGQERSFSQSVVVDIREFVQREVLRAYRHKDGHWSYPSYKQARRKLLAYLYNPRGEFSWAQRVLRVVNSKHDIEVLDRYLMDALRATITGRRDIGQIIYQRDQPDGCIYRTKGRHVNANRHKTDTPLEGWLTIRCMQNALHTSRAAYESLLSQIA